MKPLARSRSSGRASSSHTTATACGTAPSSATVDATRSSRAHTDHRHPSAVTRIFQKASRRCEATPAGYGRATHATSVRSVGSSTVGRAVGSTRGIGTVHHVFVVVPGAESTVYSGTVCGSGSFSSSSTSASQMELIIHSNREMAGESSSCCTSASVHVARSKSSMNISHTRASSDSTREGLRGGAEASSDTDERFMRLLPGPSVGASRISQAC
mmetsp:Transcript_2685/g.6031  ORF Transcript_2685/g.6031 Transcript_2685/m.6031 type:complete len:214 (-) Transcript_2685:295-936(-)